MTIEYNLTTGNTVVSIPTPTELNKIYLEKLQQFIDNNRKLFKDCKDTLYILRGLQHLVDDFTSANIKTKVVLVNGMDVKALGAKGGTARAKKYTPAQLSEMSRRAAATRTTRDPTSFKTMGSKGGKTRAANHANKI